MKRLIQLAFMILLVPHLGAQAVPVMQQMEDWHQKWLADDRALSEQIKLYGTDFNYFKAKGIDPSAKIAELQTKRVNQDAVYSKQVRDVLASASQLRGSPAVTEEDKAADEIFAKASKGMIRFSDMHQLMLYARKIAR